MAEPIGVALQQLADLGVFYYVLPFLLVFALVFAILQKVKILGGQGQNEDNRAISAIIALAVALMAIQFDFVPTFFSIIFPKLGIALSILLAGMILVGLFVDFSKPKSNIQVIFIGIAGIAFIIILLQSFDSYSWWYGGWWQNNMPAIVAGIIVVVVIGVIVSSGRSDHTNPPWVIRTYDGK